MGKIINGIEQFTGVNPEQLSEKMSLDGWKETLFGNEKTKGAAEQIASGAKTERTSLFGDLVDTGQEIGESILWRLWPKGAKYMEGLKSGFDAFTGGEEDVPWEHELEMAVAFSGLVPDFLKRPFTDMLKTPILAILESGLYPGGDKLAAHIREEDDPDDLIEVIGTVNQDIMTGKVSMETVWKNLLKGSNIPFIGTLGQN